MITGDMQHLGLPSLGGTGNVDGGKHKATDNNDENGLQGEGASKRKPDDPTIRKKILG